MSTMQAGWFPDPRGEPQLRFWDGASWTEYTRPLLAAPVADAADSSSAYGYLSAPTQSGAPVVVATWATLETAPTPATDAPPSRMAGLVLRGALVAVLVLGAFVVLDLVRAGDGGGSTPSGAPPVTTATETLEVGTEVSGAVEGDGVLEIPVSVTSAGWHSLDIRAVDSGDAGASLYDDSDALIWQADDRGNVLSDRMGGGSLDPYGFADLPVGEYTLVVNEWRGEEMEITAALAFAEVDPLEADVPLAVSVAQDDTAIFVLPDGPGSYIIEANSDGVLDPRLVLVGPSEPHTVLDDRGPNAAATNGGNERDPYGEITLPDGPTLAVLDEVYGIAVDVELILSTP